MWAVVWSSNAGVFPCLIFTIHHISRAMTLTVKSGLCLLLETQPCSQENINLTCGKETFLSTVQAGITQMKMNWKKISLYLIENKQTQEKTLLFMQPFYDMVRLILDSGGGAVFAVLYF